MPTQDEMLEHAKKRTYEDFAKKRQEIEHMPEGKRKAKALHIWYILAELVGCNWQGIRQLDYEDQTGVYHKP